MVGVAVEVTRTVGVAFWRLTAVDEVAVVVGSTAVAVVVIAGLDEAMGL